MNVIPQFRRIRLLGIALCLAAGVFLQRDGPPPAAETNAVTAWNANASDATIAACILGAGPQEARMYAMMHVAIHDALNGIDRRSRPYAASLTAAPGASPEAAVAAAARDVLVAVLGSFSSSSLRIAPTRASPAWKTTTRQRSAQSERDREDTGGGPGTGSRCSDPGLALRGRLRRRRGGSELPPGGQRSRRVPLYAQARLRLRATFGRRPHPLRAEGRFAVPAGSAVLADQPQLRGGRQRDSAPRRR